ncbi:DUF3299 domain-containing protein [Halopseudomonas salegens]|uniref:DUF3299 domain-containing protein n=1 Tax=Halopseudomonas salegens TaxID=1434072 RepID=A0A1H2HPN6_9GAMM|nr:DUF3299 domain-containing protein [Halopseudomonas salegens]SDU33772.1 hypothetical protein SAMN05216210_3207 [Halopseudomonas salegens]
MRYWLYLLLLLPLLTQANSQTIDWLDLLPEEDLEAILNMPEIEHDYDEEAPGTFEQSLRQRDRKLPDVMYSTRVVSAMDGIEARLAGFPVPLETNERGHYVSFFLVPYAGACIHVPPPPPNQIVLVDYPEGLPIEDIYTAYWVSGSLHIEQTSNALADASYRLQAHSVRIYDGE